MNDGTVFLIVLLAGAVIYGAAATAVSIAAWTEITELRRFAGKRQECVNLHRRALHTEQKASDHAR